MKKTSLLIMLLALLGLNVACNQDRSENKGKEAMEEMEHEADEVGDKLENAGEELAE